MTPQESAFSYVAEEQFEVAGEELQRHFSMDKGLTPERLRAAPAGEHYQPQPLDELFEGSPRISTGADLLLQQDNWHLHA